MYKKVFSIVLVLTIVLVAMVPAVFAATRDQEPNEPGMVGNGYGQDDRSHPLEDKRRALMQQVVIEKIKGNISADVSEVVPGEFDPLGFEGSDPVWTVLGEFSDFPHNSIPEPDRDYDNTTLWVGDSDGNTQFEPEYYMDMLFNTDEGANSMARYYLEQSSGLYTVEGLVTDWITVPGKALDYDDGAPVGPSCGPCVWSFIQDSVEGWYDQQLAAGKTPDDINAYLEKFDVWDRYDFDGDENYDEPDGYIDHFQSVHAGEGNEAGGGALGDRAIWSHSWYAFPCPLQGGEYGPEFNPQCGIQIKSADEDNPSSSDYWIGKYVINPENGGVGVFAHEYGHDLGLPDLYDYTGENSTGFWTLMSSGSWLSAEGSNDIGSKPSHLGAWEKLQLGWLNFIQVDAPVNEVIPGIELGPMEFNSDQYQALIVTLPDKYVIDDIGTPYEGDYLYYSGSGDRLDNFMYKYFNLDPGAEFSAMVNYEIETDWDYAYLVVSTDAGEMWEDVETNLSSTADPNLQNYGYGITGASDGWVKLTADLSEYEGDVLLGFRYWTDGNTVGHGFMADNLIINGSEADGAEKETDWIFDGFFRTTEKRETYNFNAYVAEFRQYTLNDEVLKNAYNFYWPGSYPLFNWVEHYPYQDGLLINYWDESFPNNNITARCNDPDQRCGGLLLPVDAHPEVLYQKGAVPWRNRLQTYDSTFGLDPTDEFTLHWRDSKLSERFTRGEIGGLAGNPTFCDYNSYHDPANPTTSVIVPETGTKITVNGVSDYTADGAYMVVSVDKCEPPVEE